MVLRSGLWVLRVRSEGAQEGAPTGCLSLAVISGGSPLVTLLLVSMLSPLEPCGSNTISSPYF